MQRADDAKRIGRLGKLWEQLAEADAGNLGWNRGKRTPVIQGRGRLGQALVEHEQEALRARLAEFFRIELLGPGEQDVGVG